MKRSGQAVLIIGDAVDKTNYTIKSLIPKVGFSCAIRPGPEHLDIS